MLLKITKLNNSKIQRKNKKIEAKNKKILEKNEIILKKQEQKIKELNKQMLQSEYSKLCKDLNEIFNSFNSDVKKHLQIKKLKSKTKKITFQDALAYMFLYNQLDETKQSIIAKLYKDYNIDISRQSIDDKFKLIPLEAITQLFNKIDELTKTYNLTDEELTFIAVDRTYNNTNDNREIRKTQTSLNMAFFDVYNCTPLEIKYYGFKKKNHEVKVLKEMLESNNLKNAVLILDRAYYDKQLMIKLLEQNLHFIIRIKNNTTITNETMKEQFEKINNNKLNLDNFRIIKYEKNIKNDYIGTNNINYDLITSNKFTIITNLNKEVYDDLKIEELYKKRWKIEVFFKCLKRNFKFAHLKEFNANEHYNKTYLISMISIHILMILEKIYMKYDDTKNFIIKKDKTKVEVSVLLNKTLLIQGLNAIIFYIIKGNLTIEILYSIKKYHEIMKNELNRSFPVVSITPHTKWYVKAYSNKNKYDQIGDAILKNDLSDLNKNIKIIARQSILINKTTNKIIKITLNTQDIISTII